MRAFSVELELLERDRSGSNLACVKATLARLRNRLNELRRKTLHSESGSGELAQAVVERWFATAN
jgi:hypothetical protein